MKCVKYGQIGCILFESDFHHVRTPVTCLNSTHTVEQPVYSCQMCLYAYTMCKYATEHVISGAKVLPSTSNCQM